jgi:hypothetical protein
MAIEYTNIFKKEKLFLITIIAVISILLLLLLCFCPKSESMVNGIMNILSAIVGSITTILVQKTNNKSLSIDEK